MTCLFSMPHRAGRTSRRARAVAALLAGARWLARRLDPTVCDVHATHLLSLGPGLPDVWADPCVPEHMAYVVPPGQVPQVVNLPAVPGTVALSAAAAQHYLGMLEEARAGFGERAAQAAPGSVWADWNTRIDLLDERLAEVRTALGGFRG